TKLLDIVIIAKQLLMTRGALTIASISSDIIKYFTIIPAMFGTLYMDPKTHLGPLSILNFMHLHTPHSAILSAVIVNAFSILTLLPLALRGVSYNAQSAYDLLKQNILIYGLGGAITCLIAIKVIDQIISFLRIV